MINEVLESYAVEVRGPDGQYVRLRYDGEVEYSGSPSAAAKLFWEEVKRYMEAV
jgi:hypothetical protein